MIAQAGRKTNKTRMEVNNKKLGMIGQRLYYGQRVDLVGVEERKEPCFRNKIFRVWKFLGGPFWNVIRFTLYH